MKKLTKAILVLTLALAGGVWPYSFCRASEDGKMSGGVCSV